MVMPGETVYRGAEEPDGERLQVLHSGAGHFYLGFLEDGMPYSRETIYAQNEMVAQKWLAHYIAGGWDNIEEVLR